MRRTGPARQPRPVPTPDHVRVTIDFDLRGSPIAGVMRDGRGHSEPFAGWMALTRTIERALDAARQAELDIVPEAPARPGSAAGSPSSEGLG